MHEVLKRVRGGLLALAIGVTPAVADEVSPAGSWLISSQDSLYEVAMCGSGKELCAKLVWLGHGADNKQNRPYLNTFLIENAKPAGRNRWKGMLHVFGQKAPGTIKLVSADKIELSGCVYFVVCRTYVLNRVR